MHKIKKVTFYLTMLSMDTKFFYNNTTTGRKICLKPLSVTVKSQKTIVNMLHFLHKQKITSRELLQCIQKQKLRTKILLFIVHIHVFVSNVLYTKWINYTNCQKIKRRNFVVILYYIFFLNVAAQGLQPDLRPGWSYQDGWRELLQATRSVSFFSQKFRESYENLRSERSGDTKRIKLTTGFYKAIIIFKETVTKM